MRHAPAILPGPGHTVGMPLHEGMDMVRSAVWAWRTEAARHAGAWSLAGTPVNRRKNVADRKGHPAGWPFLLKWNAVELYL
jgi:hypothetical protein